MPTSPLPTTLLFFLKWFECLDVGLREVVRGLVSPTPFMESCEQQIERLHKKNIWHLEILVRNRIWPYLKLSLQIFLLFGMVQYFSSYISDFFMEYLIHGSAFAPRVITYQGFYLSLQIINLFPHIWYSKKCTTVGLITSQCSNI